MCEKIEFEGYEIPVGWYREQCLKLYPDRPEFCEVFVKDKVEEVKKKLKRYNSTQGYKLVFYNKERQVFKDAYTIKLSDSEAVKIAKKLTRHFKLKFGSVRFYGNSQSGRCSWWTAELRLSHNPSLGLVCHEVAHLGEKRHSKKLMKLMGKLIRYCEKMKYWRSEE